ncbi:MAG TPA: 3-hydroxybutyrate dehydrogenase [Steroidobacteraceae bacterium]
MRHELGCKDKVVVVTGAARGIGKEIAAQFVLAGARVCVADVDGAAAQATAAEIGAADFVMPLALDVTDEEQVNAGMRAVAERFGALDVLISNAGTQHIAAIVDLQFAQWKRLLAVHLDGAFLTTRACMRHMIARGAGGSIIYMGSVHSHLASPLKAPYATAKHGLLGLARTVAKEGAPHGIRSNLVCPGFVRTALVDAQIAPQAAALRLAETQVIHDVLLKDTVDGQFTTTAEVAQVTVFLASFPTNALTGQSIVVSHGWHMD